MHLTDKVKNHPVVVVLVTAATVGSCVAAIVAASYEHLKNLDSSRFENQIIKLESDLKECHKSQPESDCERDMEELCVDSLLLKRGRIPLKKPDPQIARVFDNVIKLSTTSPVVSCDLCGKNTLDWISVFPSSTSIDHCRESIIEAVRNGAKIRILLPSIKEENLPNINAFATASGLSRGKVVDDIKEAIVILKEMRKNIGERNGSLKVRSCVRPLFSNMWVRDQGTNAALAPIGVHGSGLPSFAPWWYVRVGGSSTSFLAALSGGFEQLWLSDEHTSTIEGLPPHKKQQ